MNRTRIFGVFLGIGGLGLMIAARGGFGHCLIIGGSDNEVVDAVVDYVSNVTTICMILARWLMLGGGAAMALGKKQSNAPVTY